MYTQQTAPSPYVTATETFPCGSTVEMAGDLVRVELWCCMAASKFLCQSCLLSRGTPTAGCIVGPTGHGAVGSSTLAPGGGWELMITGGEGRS